MIKALCILVLLSGCAAVTDRKEVSICDKFCSTRGAYFRDIIVTPILGSKFCVCSDGYEIKING